MSAVDYTNIVPSETVVRWSRPQSFTIRVQAPDGEHAEIVLDPETKTVSYTGGLEPDAAAKLFFEMAIQRWNPCTCRP